MAKELISQPFRLEKRIHVALPIRVSYWDADGKPRLELACTYDISARGARVTGLRCVKEAGEVITIERGRSKAFCRVIWIGEANSHLQGQLGIECVEPGKSLWDQELRDMVEIYDTIPRETKLTRALAGSGNYGSNRRRFERFHVEGFAELMRLAEESVRLEAGIKDISEMGCLLAAPTLVRPGTDFQLGLRVANYDMSFKGQVRHAAVDVGIGIEFREIRKGDRPMLQYLLRTLAENRQEESTPLVKSAAATK